MFQKGYMSCGNDKATVEPLNYKAVRVSQFRVDGRKKTKIRRSQLIPLDVTVSEIRYVLIVSCPDGLIHINTSVKTLECRACWKASPL